MEVVFHFVSGRMNFARGIRLGFAGGIRFQFELRTFGRSSGSHFCEEDERVFSAMFSLKRSSRVNRSAEEVST